MTAQDITLTIDEALSRASLPLRRKIQYSIDLVRSAEPMALRLDPDNGFFNTFSGGKDSQALFYIVKLAGVKHRTYMSLTSIDPPEVIRFVRREYPDVELLKPTMSIFSMSKRKHFLPTRRLRWCCAEFKECVGTGKVTLIGVRHEESARRARRGEISTSIKGKRSEQSFDQFSEHSEQMVTCVGGKDKILVSPIIHWTERGVWEFLNNVIRAPHCELYDQGQQRIGCLCCPMSNLRQKLKDIQRYPHVRRNWLKTIQWFIDNGYASYNFTNPEDAFDWWLSGESYKKWYADKYLQQRIDFDKYY